MATTCTRCESTGFLNVHQLPEAELKKLDDGDLDAILKWIAENKGHDVQVCDCCGDGDDWYGEPGAHYTSDDPSGSRGPYAYNGGLCEYH